MAMNSSPCGGDGKPSWCDFSLTSFGVRAFEGTTLAIGSVGSAGAAPRTEVFGGADVALRTEQDGSEYSARCEAEGDRDGGALSTRFQPGRRDQ